jgi:hypothetical protein
MKRPKKNLWKKSNKQEKYEEKTRIMNESNKKIKNGVNFAAEDRTGVGGRLSLGFR